MILDGRDIGTRVLPDATLKVFLTASPEVRARRRCDELNAKGQSAAYEDVLNDVMVRDRQDTTRAVDPLTPAADAVTLDTSAMALVPVIQPAIMRALTTKKERMIVMDQLRPVSKREKIIFPIAVTVIVSLMLPAAAPLIGMLMLGNLFRESGVVERLSKTSENDLNNIVVIFLGVTVGATANAETFLNVKTLEIIALGMGSTNTQIVFKVLLPEAVPSLMNGAAISITTILSYTALASAAGGGGLGALAIVKGLNIRNFEVMYTASLLLVALVQIITVSGTRMHSFNSAEPTPGRTEHKNSRQAQEVSGA